MLRAPFGIDKHAQFGRSVSFYGDRLVVGALNDRDVGSVFVYHRLSGSDSWAFETKLAPDIPDLNNFGRIVSIQGDVILVGDRIYGNPRKGAVFVYVYDKPSKLWQLTSHITNNDCDQWFGASVEILDDGLMIGCPREDGGAAYYYKGDRKKYTFKQKIQSSNLTYYDHFAHNGQLSISFNPRDQENIMAVGTHTKRNGTTYLFTLLKGRWLEFAKINEPRATEYFGDVVDISGKDIVIASGNNAYLYSIERCLDLI